MKKIIFLLILLFLTGCVNKEGISLRYYSNCHPEYDYYGTYHYVCPNNIINFKKKKTNTEDCLQCN